MYPNLISSRATIKPLEEERWRFRFDKTVGQLKHDPRQDTLTVTVDGKTQVFHRQPDTGQPEGDLADHPTLETEGQRTHVITVSAAPRRG